MPHDGDISDEDKALFRKAMRGVKVYEKQDEPLVQTKPTTKPRTVKQPIKYKTTHPTTPAKRLEGSANYTRSDASILPDPITAETLIHCAKSGVNPRQLRRLKNGKLQAAASLDLHGLTVDNAYKAVRRFLERAHMQNLGIVHIITGKGRHHSKRSAPLKSSVCHWLLDHTYVTAFSTCQPKDGGLGAFYVLIRRHSKV